MNERVSIRPTYQPSSPDEILAARRARLREANGDLIDQIAVRRVPKEEVGCLVDGQGRDTKTIQRLNVFEQWGRDKGGTPEAYRDAKALAAHGLVLMALYARAHGITGGKDLSLYDYVDNDMGPKLSKDWRQYMAIVTKVRANDDLSYILSQVGAVSRSVLIALCWDWYYGDDAPLPKAKGRREASWRAIVRAACKEHGRNLSTPNEESAIIWECLTNLKHAQWRVC